MQVGWVEDALPTLRKEQDGNIVEQLSRKETGGMTEYYSQYAAEGRKQCKIGGTSKDADIVRALVSAKQQQCSL